MAYKPTRFRRTPDGLVELEGRFGVGSGPGGAAENPDPQHVFTLPEGFRPAEEQHVPAESANGPTVVTITTGGDVLADPNDGWIDLHVSFHTDDPNPD